MSTATRPKSALHSESAIEISKQKLDTTTRLVIFLVLSILFIPFCWDFISNLSTYFLGIEEVDHYGTQWFYWFVQHQLELGKGIDQTNLFFFPYGKDILLHTGSNVLDAYLAIPFRMVFGHVLGYNIFVLLCLGLSGWALYHFAREFTEDRLAAWVAALLFVFSPYVLYETAEGRPTQSILGPLVIFLMFMWRSGRQRGLRSPFYAGLALAVCGYQYWYYAFFGGLVCIAHGIWRFYRPPEDAGNRFRILSRHVLIAAVSVGLCAPMAVPMLLLSSTDASIVPGLLNTDLWSITNTPPVTAEGRSVALLIWQPLHRQSGFFLQKGAGIEEFLPHQDVTNWMAIVLVFAYLFKPGKLDRGAFLAVALMAALIAVGPLLTIGRYYLPNPLYIYLAKSISFIRRLWWPARAYAIITILICLAAAMVISQLKARGRKIQYAAALTIAAIWSGELYMGHLSPFPSWDGHIPKGYQCLAEGEAGAIIELPYAWTQAHLYYQTAHGRPILGGMVENNPLFSPPRATQLRENNTFLSSLLSISRLDTSVHQWSRADKEGLHDLGYDYVVVQKAAYHRKSSVNLADNAQRTRFRRMRRGLKKLIGDPIFDDARISIYAPWKDPLPCDKEENGVDLTAWAPTAGGHILGFRTKRDVALKKIFKSSQPDTKGKRPQPAGQQDIKGPPASRPAGQKDTPNGQVNPPAGQKNAPGSPMNPPAGQMNAPGSPMNPPAGQMNAPDQAPEEILPNDKR